MLHFGFTSSWSRASILIPVRVEANSDSGLVDAPNFNIQEIADRRITSVLGNPSWTPAPGHPDLVSRIAGKNGAGDLSGRCTNFKLRNKGCQVAPGNFE